jgi:MOSC domain-containing protein YiiM
MTDARVISVNTGLVADRAFSGRPERTGIDKRPARGRVAVGRLGLDGDECGDLANHGGQDQAVYAYAREDLDWWTERLGRELRNGQFGENITTAGLDITGASIGETWQLGSAVVQVTAPRIPCGTFAGWMGEPQWVKRFAAAARPGAYLRVLSEDSVGAGDPVRVLSKPDRPVTIAESVAAFYGDRDLMRQLLAIDGRGASWTAVAERVLRPARV